MRIDRQRRMLPPAIRERRTEQRAHETPRTRRWQRGQGLIIFALSATVLIGLAGLSLDVMRVYDLYAREQRAAEAGALAGDLYMPNYYTTTFTSGTTNFSAVTRALAETAKDGFPAASNGDCNNVGVTDGVYVCHVAGDHNGLQVTITQHIDVFLLSVVGVQGFDVSSSGTASYLTPFILGTQNPNDVNSSYWSDGGLCNANPQNCKSINPPNHFVAFINGPAEMKEQGDPYVYCQDGDSYANTQQTPDPSATLGLNSTDPTTGWQTNFPKYATPHCGSGAGGNQDQQTSGSGPFLAANPTGHTYSYGITVSPGANVSVWLWNPAFEPTLTSGSSCPGLTQLDSFYETTGCASYYPYYGCTVSTVPCPAADQVVNTSGGLYDNPRLYFNMGYALYKVDVSFGSSAMPIWQQSFPPYDLMPSDLSAHCPSVGTGGGWLPDSTVGAGDGKCTNANTVNQYGFAQVGNKLGPGSYKLTVTAYPWDDDATCAASLSGTCGWGFHSYAIVLCPGTTNNAKQVTSCTLKPLANGQPAATVNPWGDMAISYDFQANNGQDVIPIADVPATFAGRTVTISIFNPGRSNFGGGGDMWFAVVPPTKSDLGVANPAITPTYPKMLGSPGGAFLTTIPCPGGLATQYCPSAAANQYWIHASTAGSPQPSDDFEGLWIEIQFQLPAGYLGGQWWFTTAVTGTGFDHIAVNMSINGGSPVHLVG